MYVYLALFRASYPPFGGFLNEIFLPTTPMAEHPRSLRWLIKNLSENVMLILLIAEKERS